MRGGGYLYPANYSLHCHHQNDSALRRAAVSDMLNVSFIVWAKSQDGVRKPHILKRKESRSGSNRGRSAYQPSALPLSHTGAQRSCRTVCKQLSESVSRVRRAGRAAVISADQQFTFSVWYTQSYLYPSGPNGNAGFV